MTKKGPKSLFTRNLRNLEDRPNKREPQVVISFKQLDPNQGQSLENWQESKILALAITKLKGLCECTVIQALSQQLIKVYKEGTWPENTDFKHPHHVPQDVRWSSMHVKGKPCVIGYFEDNIFHIVFLDKEHEFWKTEKKNT